MKWYLTPLLHPAAIVRGRWELEAPQETYLRRIKENPYPTLPNLDLPPPNCNLYPTLEDLDVWQLEPRRLGAAACDVEACGPWPICFGVIAFSLATGAIGPGICLRFRVRGGGRYWEAWEEHVRATQWLYQFLADPSITKVFHNGTGFDVPEMEALGFRVEGVVLDTLVVAHACYSELPKSLAFQANLFCGCGFWKHLVDPDAEEEGKG